MALLLTLSTSLHEVWVVQAPTWSAPLKITPALSIETKAYPVEDDQGVLWVVYESLRASNFDIYGRRWDGAGWLGEDQLTYHASADQNPALVQLANGTMLLVWASNRSGGYSLFSKRLNGGIWSAEAPLTVSPGNDSTPSILQSRNGTLWLFWTRQTVSGQNVIYDIYHKTHTNGVWTPDQPLVYSTAHEYQQSVVQADDDTIWLLYGSDKLGNLDVYYRRFTGTWSAETPLTSNVDDDRQGWIMQDLNGTIWAFWARCVKTGATCQDDIFYRVSYNQGSSWSSETQYTIDPVGVEVFDTEPAAFHARDKKIYLFWTTNLTGDGGDFDIYYSTTPIPIHDVGSWSVTPYPTSATSGDTVRVNATIGNLGDYTETVQVHMFYESTSRVLFNSSSLTLPPSRSMKVQASWETPGAPPGSYRIVVQVQPVSGESPRRTSDNTAFFNNVTVLPRPGDVNLSGRVDFIDFSLVAFKYRMMIGPEDLDGDCAVGILDLALLALAYKSRPGDPNWNPRADLDQNGIVDLLDLATLAFKYGTKIGPEDINKDCKVNLLDLAIVAYYYNPA